MNLALSVASTIGANAGTPAGAAGVGGVGLCMGGLSKQGDGGYVALRIQLRNSFITVRSQAIDRTHSCLN